MHTVALLLQSTQSALAELNLISENGRHSDTSTHSVHPSIHSSTSNSRYPTHIAFYFMATCKFPINPLLKLWWHPSTIRPVQLPFFYIFALHIITSISLGLKQKSQKKTKRVDKKTYTIMYINDERILKKQNKIKRK